MLRRLTLTLAVGALCLLMPAAANATFPGGNGRIGFTSNEPVGCSAVFTVAPDGSGRNQVTDCAPSRDNVLTLAWSPNGQRIAFSSDDALWTVSPDGTGYQLVFANEGVIRGVGWSPDGTKLVFSTLDPACGSCTFGAALSTINPDGTGRSILLNDTTTDPDWSPDGARIVFASGSQLFTIRPDGGGLTQLTTGGPAKFSPSWSPDGTKIAFAGGNGADQEIYSISANGTGQAQLTSSAGRDVTPAWSPDGTTIAFASVRDDPTCDKTQPFGCRFQLYTMNTAGGGVTRFTNSQASDLEPAWESVPGPRRSDYKNSAHFCKAERDFLGEAPFKQKYGGGANAYGKCVTGH